MHGYLSNKESFSAQVEYFSKFYRVTAFDFLGQGQSAPLESPFSVDDYAQWTAELLSALGVVHPHVIAHSFGCRVAVKMAKCGRQVFDKIVLTGAAGIVLPRGIGYHIKVKTYRLIKKIAPKFAERHFGSAEYRTLSQIMKESYKKIVNEDLRAFANEITNEVLLIQGKGDTVTPMAAANVYLNAFPNARLVEMQGGHFAFAEHPLAFNLIVEEFLDDG